MNKAENNIRKVVEDVFNEQSTYKETRYADGSIRIQSNNNGRTLDIMGGPGFAKQFDKDFDKAMKAESVKYKDR